MFDPIPWYYLADCACLWKEGGGVADLPTRIADESADRQKRLLTRTEGPVEGGLLALITEIMTDAKYQERICNAWQPSGWPATLPLGVRRWAVTDVPGVLMVLTPQAAYLMIASHARLRLYHEDVRTAIPALVPDASEQLWLDPFMRVVDNDLLEPDTSTARDFRDAVRGHAGQVNVSDLVRAEITKAKPNFRMGFDRLDFDVAPNRPLPETTFASDGARLTLTLGVAEPPRTETGMRKELLAPKWECGNQDCP